MPHGPRLISLEPSIWSAPATGSRTSRGTPRRPPTAFESYAFSSFYLPFRWSMMGLFFFGSRSCPLSMPFGSAPSLPVLPANGFLACEGGVSSRRLGHSAGFSRFDRNGPQFHGGLPFWNGPNHVEDQSRSQDKRQEETMLKTTLR